MQMHAVLFTVNYFAINSSTNKEVYISKSTHAFLANLALPYIKQRGTGISPHPPRNVKVMMS